MTWIGKIGGGLLGFASAGPIGAVIGFVLGHQFDRGMVGRPVRRVHSATAADRQRVFFETTFLVMGHLAKVDGRVSEDEIRATRNVMQGMRLGEREARLAIDLFNAGKRPDFPVEAQLDRLRRYCGRYPQLLRTFLEIQLDLALVKGAVTPPERELLSRIGGRLGVGRVELMQLEALLRVRRGAAGNQQEAHRGNALEKAYGVLGVAPAASDREVKLAYRRLINRHHPDKQIARGLPDSMLELEKERTREILAAYDSIKEHRGFK